MKKQENTLILASNSPRRKELLELAGIDFVVKSANIEEIVEDGLAPEQVVMSLSSQKAMAVAKENPGNVVLGADTVVVYDGEILGKPGDEAEALDMLSMLSGRTHRVYTGVTICKPDEKDSSQIVSESFFDMTEVTMYDNDRQSLLEYIATGEPMDKAGAYGIQGKGALLIKGIIGDYYNVMGLPIALVARKLNGMV